MSGHDQHAVAGGGEGAPKADPRKRGRARKTPGASARDQGRRRARSTQRRRRLQPRAQIAKSLVLFGRTSDGVMAIGPDCRILMWNHAAEALLGYTASEVHGRRCYEVIRGRDAHGNVFCHAHCPVLVMTRQRELPYAYDVIASTKESVSRRLNMSTVLLSTQTGPVVVHLFRDLSARHQEGRPVEIRRQPQAVSPLELDETVPATRLTRREREVLQLMAQGHGTDAIARRLVITHATARSHIQNILTKLGVHSRLEAVVQALRPPGNATAHDGA